MVRKLSRQGERALSDANEIARQGLDAQGEERLALARRALATSPLCARAHVLRAMEAERHSDDAIAHWRRAVSAGATAIGPAGFRDLTTGKGDGGDHAGPYIHALQGLATALWARGVRPEAIETLQRAVRSDPEDEFVLRYTLIGWLLAVGRDHEARALLGMREPTHDKAEWNWSALLLAFRTAADTEETRTMRRETMRANLEIPRALIRGEVPEDAWKVGTSPLDPARQPFDEAECVLESVGEAWRETPGALDWLAAGLDATAKDLPP